MAKREKFSIFGREPDTKKGCDEFIKEKIVDTKKS